MNYSISFDPATFPAREGAKHTLEVIEKSGKLHLLGSLLDEVFGSAGMPTAGEINDFLWFERSMIFETLGITEV